MNSWKSEVLSTVKSVKVHQSLAITTDHHRSQITESQSTENSTQTPGATCVHSAE